MDHQLRYKHQVGLALQASKWLKVPLLIDEEEMKLLFLELGEFAIYPISGIVKPGEGVISHKDFLSSYEEYIQGLRQGHVEISQRQRNYFSSALSVTPEALYAVKLSENEELIKVERPVILSQLHQVIYSTVDGSFRSMGFGTDAISWGIQFSYPQLFQTADLEVKQVKENEEFPNTALFKKLQRWVREHTRATPFLVNQKKTNVPIRLGLNCFSWINQHPQLTVKGIQVIN